VFRNDAPNNRAADRNGHHAVKSPQFGRSKIMQMHCLKSL